MGKWRRGGRGFVLIELVVVIAVIAVLLGLGYSVYRGARAAARVATAESNLRQIGTALELFFQKYGAYPLQTTNLTAALAPFVKNPGVLKNPFVDETEPGATLNLSYVEPLLEDIDSAGEFVVGFANASDGYTVVLETGGRIEKLDFLSYTTQGSKKIVWPSDRVTGRFRGLININPRNNDDFDFWMDMNGNGVRDDPDITRETLMANGGQFGGKFAAFQVFVCPKGNGNQNGLFVDPEGDLPRGPLDMQNGLFYTIVPDKEKGLQTFWVELFNDNVKGPGQSMGKWWAKIRANDVTMTWSKGGYVLP